jgi:Alpha galactosidase C-terminal beta sandwich domain
MLTLWAVLPSPLMLGANLTLTTDAFFAALVTNEEVIAVGQDDLGAKARFIVRTGTTEVWSKDLSGGRKAVGLFNRGATDATVSITWAALGLAAPAAVRNLWTRTDLGVMASGASLTVPWHAAALLLVTPPAPPPSDGGAAGTGGGPGGPDAAPDAGPGPDAGRADAVGDSAPGGAAGSAGAGGGPSTGGGGAGGGGAGATGSGDAGASTATSSSGCGCALAETSGRTWPCLLVAFAALVTRRRSRRR